MAAFAVVLPSGSALAQIEITLDQATTLALQNQPAVIAALGGIRVAEARRREYLGDWLPSLSGTGSWSRNSSSRFDPNTQRTVSAGASSAYSTGLSASFTVFDGFRRNAVGRSTRANIESAEATLVSEEFRIVLETKQAFFNALAAEELVRVAATRIERAQGQLRITRDKLAAGSAIRSDTLRSFVELGNARLQLLNAETQRETATANLARLIGVDERVRVVSDASMEALVALDTAALRTELLAASPLIEQASAQARAAGAQVGVSKSQYFPSLVASFQQSWSGSQLDALNNQWSARVNLSWPLFNGFSREASVAQSVASQEAALARVEDARRQVNAQATQQFAALEAALVRFEIARASQAAATEDLRVQQERYRLGASTIVEVLQSQESLDQAAVDAVEARLDYFIAKAQLEALIGREI